ncbi:hypothetical protein HDV00_008962 [Rhizophlyctis rosea]|nr:hypothetical protein HDV00_008962 [Rhizophlyctis rosea]
MTHPTIQSIITVFLIAFLTLTHTTHAHPHPVPNPTPDPPPNLDCIVLWSQYGCCTANVKKSTGQVLVPASGNGKPCPYSLTRTDYCVAGDKDCDGSNVGRSAVAKFGTTCLIVGLGTAALMI